MVLLHLSYKRGITIFRPKYFFSTRNEHFSLLCDTVPQVLWAWCLLSHGNCSVKDVQHGTWLHQSGKEGKRQCPNNFLTLNQYLQLFLHQKNKNNESNTAALLQAGERTRQLMSSCSCRGPQLSSSKSDSSRPILSAPGDTAPPSGTCRHLISW